MLFTLQRNRCQESYEVLGATFYLVAENSPLDKSANP